MAKTALDDIRVLEYCHSIAGASCAKQLADLGAEVIKIEKPLTGDQARRAGAFPKSIPHPEKSSLFLYVNTNKLGITLDPAAHQGRELFRKLVKNCNIVIEDNPPGYMDSLKLGYQDLQAIQPGIIMTSITPFGQTGPYAQYKAYPLNVFHSSGIGHITPEGYKNLERPPLKQGKYVTGYHCGVGASLITLGALYKCETTSRGLHIDFSMQEWEMNLMKPKWEMFTFENFVPSRKTVVRQGHGMTPCKNGYVIIMLLEEHQWINLCDMASKPEWLTDERFLDPYKRAENGDALSKTITDWAKDYTMEEIFKRGQEASVPVGMINKPEDLFSSQQLAERKFFAEVDHPIAGKFKYPSTPYKMSETPSVVRYPAPALGQHNEEIYCSRLGYTREDLVTLRRACVI
jgi:CoA:oxalate CoA-transferase